MKSLLDTALCMLDDRHIEEAATYAPQTKTISLKKILPLAVCFVLVVVSAFAVKNYFSPVVTTVSPTITTSDDFAAPGDPYTTVACVIDESTTVANAPEKTSTTTPTTSAGTVKISLYCTAPMEDYTGWENMPFDSFYHLINIGNVSYYSEQPLSEACEPLSEKNLGKLLYEFSRSDYRFMINGSSDFTVQVYEIRGYSQERAIAVGRKDGLMKGYYAYYNTSDKEWLALDVLDNCETLADIIDFADISESYNPDNFCTSFRAYYKEENKEYITYSIGINEKLATLLLENRDVKAEWRTGNTGERLSFDAYLKRYYCEIYLCNDGYLYLRSDGLTRAFNIGVENYEKFYNAFKLSSVVWTPENPVTVG